MTRRRAFITGVTGQDGHYLASHLVTEGYEVHGLALTAESEIPLPGGVHLHVGDIRNRQLIRDLLGDLEPAEIYNLAGQARVDVSFGALEETFEINGLAAVRLLETAEELGLLSKTRFFQASSAEMFGPAAPAPQTETTPFDPATPYALSKYFAHKVVAYFREVKNAKACSAILFNHESPYRGPGYVTRKITRAAAAASLGSKDVLRLGNLNARRDWGHARDYAKAMWLMVQQDQPQDLVLASGIGHSVRDFVNAAYGEIGRGIEWRGEGESETGVDAESGELLVSVDAAFFRPIDTSDSLGNPEKALEVLGWRAATSFETLVSEMVQADIAALRGRPEG